ncbi:MAG: NAD(P)/FAD-dependent oxidoreductase [Anaerolineales bacterium]
MKAVYDTIIIGGGQAGLAVGYYLAQQGRDFVILEAHEQIGDSWRRRWDSLKLFTPAKFSSLPGMPFPAEALHYPTKDEMADYLETYARRFNLPVQLGARVERLSREGERFVVASSGQRLTARQVVVATGAYQSPRVPTFAKDLNLAIHQIHTKHYHNPAQLPIGDTLVVGVGNSGGEIAMELAQTRQVWLSGKPTGQLPKPKKFMINLLWWFLHNATRVDTRFGRFFKSKMGHKGAPLEGLSEKDFATAGIKRLPKTVGTQDGKPVFEDGSSVDVSSIVWATGFRNDFSWIDLPVFDARGEPVHERGVAVGELELYFTGLHYLYSLSSGLIGGAKRDAGYIAERIDACSPVRKPTSLQPVPAARQAANIGE